MIVVLKYICIKVIAVEKSNMSATQSSENVIVDVKVDVNVDVENAITITPPLPVQTFYNDDCVICFESMSSVLSNGGSVVTFECDHRLCNTCTFEYAKGMLQSGQDITCPICRHVLLPSHSAKYQELRREYVPHQEVHTTITIGPRPTLMHARERYIIINNQRTCQHRCFCVLFVVTVAMLVTSLILYQSGVFQQT